MGCDAPQCALRREVPHAHLTVGGSRHKAGEGLGADRGTRHRVHVARQRAHERFGEYPVHLDCSQGSGVLETAADGGDAVGEVRKQHNDAACKDLSGLRTVCAKRAYLSRALQWVHFWVCVPMDFDDITAALTRCLLFRPRNDLHLLPEPNVQHKLAVRVSAQTKRPVRDAHSPRMSL